MGVIEDGKGTGTKAGVDNNNLLETHAYTEDYKEYILENNGTAFNINTGLITLTSASISSVLYMENTGEENMIVPKLIYLMGNSTGGSGDIIISIYKNITAGTIIDGASDVEMLHSRNLGISAPPEGNIYKGAEGNTGTGGTKIISTIVSGPTKVIIDVGNIVMPRGKNICVELTPQTGNTSMGMMVVAEMWIRN